MLFNCLPSSTFPFLQYHFHIFVQVPGLPENPPNFLVASDLNHHVTPVAVVPDVVEDLVDDSASEMGAASSQLADERERYIDQLLAEIESLQVRKSRVDDVTACAGFVDAITSLVVQDFPSVTVSRNIWPCLVFEGFFWKV